MHLLTVVFRLQNMDNIVMQEVDNSNGVIFPFVDHDTNMVYLCGKVSAPLTFNNNNNKLSLFTINIINCTLYLPKGHELKKCMPCLNMKQI